MIVAPVVVPAIPAAPPEHLRPPIGHGTLADFHKALDNATGGPR